MRKEKLEQYIVEFEGEKFVAKTALERELYYDIIQNLKLLAKISEDGLYNGVYKDYSKIKKVRED